MLPPLTRQPVACPFKLYFISCRLRNSLVFRFPAQQYCNIPYWDSQLIWQMRSFLVKAKINLKEYYNKKSDNILSPTLSSVQFTLSILLYSHRLPQPLLLLLFLGVFWGDTIEFILAEFGNISFVAERRGSVRLVDCRFLYSILRTFFVFKI